LDYDDGLITGGHWYLGYYQDDLATQASQAKRFDSMNWKYGYCNTCGSSNQVYADKYKSIRGRVVMTGFFVQAANLPINNSGTLDDRFDPTTVIVDNQNNYGFNFHITISCNLTQFWYEQRLKLKKVIGLQVCMNILKDMRSSMQNNNVVQTLFVNIVRDLEGPKDTQGMPLWKQLQNAIKALILDEGNLLKDCFPCARKPRHTIGAIGA
jgi:hypothetical protein